MPELLAYLDYRQFLCDFYAEKKRSSPFFSYRYFGSKIGVDAGNLVKVLSKERHLSRSGIDGVVGMCGFTGREERYFRALVAFGKAKKQETVRELFEQLSSMRDLDVRTVESKQYEFYRHWRHTAVLGLCHIEGFRGDYAALANRLTPRASVKEVQQSIALLVSLGLIEKGKDGVFRPTDRLLTTGEKWHSAAIHRFQEETIALAAQSLSNHPKELRDMSTVSIAVGEPELQEIRALAAQFRKEVLKVAQGSGKADRLYQLNVQLFPLSTPPKEGGDA